MCCVAVFQFVTFLVLVNFMENAILTCFFHLLLLSFSSFHAIFVDLSLMEEWPSRGKTLERHDESSAHCCCPMARSQSLKDPPTKSKQHLQNPVDMHTSLNTGIKSHPTIFLSLSLSLCLSFSLLNFFPAVCLWRSFLYSLLLFFPTKKRLSTAKKTGRESLA